MPDEMKFPPLEVPCEECNGTGISDEAKSRGCWNCFKCEGKGLLMTEFGDEVLNFIKRHVNISTKIG